MKRISEIRKDFEMTLAGMDSEECFEVLESIDDLFVAESLKNRIQNLKEEK